MFIFLILLKLSWLTVLLVPAVQRRGSIMHTHVTLSESRPAQAPRRIESSSLRTVGPVQLPILYKAACACRSQLTPPPTAPLVTMFVFHTCGSVSVL